MTQLLRPAGSAMKRERGATAREGKERVGECVCVIKPQVCVCVCKTWCVNRLLVLYKRRGSE